MRLWHAALGSARRRAAGRVWPSGPRPAAVRDDADPLVIQKRIDVYNEETAPVAEHYRFQNKYIGVQGVGGMEEIFERLSAAIKGLS